MIHDCMFCKNYRTANGDCKGLELEICGNYVDVEKITLSEKVIKVINKICKYKR